MPDRASALNFREVARSSCGTCVAQRGGMPYFQFARWCAVSCLVACGHSSSPELVDATPDSPPDSPVQNVVFVELYGETPVFVRYRTGGGEWQEPVDTGDGYEITVGADYELVAACTSETSSNVGFIAGTVDEGRSTYIPCYGPYDNTSSPTQVTGTMKQPGRVFMSASASSETPNWSFELDVSIGMQDLIALDETRVAVRRDVEVLGPTALPDVDLAAEGVALVDATFTLDTVAADETLAASLLWFTTNSGAFIPLGSTTAVKLPPSSVAGQFDTQYVQFDAYADSHYRSAYITPDPAAPTTIELLPKLEGIEFNTDGLTWPGTLPGTNADLYVYAGLHQISFTASAGWLAGRHKIAIDTDIPGFDPTWKISQPDYRVFTVSDGTQFVFRDSGVEDQSSSVR